MSKLSGLIFFFLIASGFAVPPPGSRGFIDFRYPDYIVDPLPKCPEEGVFPHPRNCTWYYRCTDVYKVGFYNRFYFECEPGTVFFDELDQCVYPFNPKYPCQGTGIQITTDKPPPRTCPDTFYVRCKSYYCPTSSGNWESIGKLCQDAYSKCTDGSEMHYCQGSLYYDVDSKKCVNNPRERECEDQIPTTTTTQSTTTTASTTPLPDDCDYSVVGCKDYKCQDTKQNQTLCRKRFMTCNKNEVTFFCSGDEYYNYGSAQCVIPPAKSGCVEIPPADAHTATVSSLIDPESITFGFTVECSPEVTRPRNPQLIDYFCRDYRSCNEDGTASQVKLCDKYLQCLYDEETKKWSAKLSTCPPSLYFSYDEDICTQIPKETC